MIQQDSINRLIQKTIENKEQLPYINLTEEKTYGGWVKDFHIYSKKTHQSIALDLHIENDLFLLFVLASCWSRAGQWENSACFVIYLKMHALDNPTLWNDLSFVEKAKNLRKVRNLEVCEYYDVPQRPDAKHPRKDISFRSDFYDSLYVLAKNWEQIKQTLSESENKNDYSIFISYISKLEGLSVGKKTMKIKVPLVLRELRIQKIYKNIPGKWCCVPDQRVRDTAFLPIFNIPIKKYNTNMNAILKSSEQIYELFGDLYDIPLFAYNDLKIHWEE